MKVVCVRCGAGWLLAPEALEPGGVDVECSACGGLFQAWHPSDPGAPAAPEGPGLAVTAEAPAPVTERDLPAAAPPAPTDQDLPAAAPPAPTDQDLPAAAPPAPTDRDLPAAASLPAAPRLEPLDEGRTAAFEEAGTLRPRPVTGRAAAFEVSGASGPLPPLEAPEPRSARSGSPPAHPEHEDTFLAGRRIRRRRGGLVVAALGVLALAPAGLYVLAPAHFDALLGRHLGLRAGWDPEAVRLRDEARAHLLLDDPESLRRSAELLSQARQADPAHPGVAADSAAAAILLAEHLRSEGRGYYARGAALSGQVEKLQARMRVTPIIDRRRLESRLDAVIAQVQELDAASAERQEEAGRWATAGYGLARGAIEKTPQDPEVRAALALYYALEEERGQVTRLTEGLAAEGPMPLWGLVATGLLEASGPLDPDRRARALDALDLGLAQEPGLLRAKWIKARVLMELERRDEALTLLREVAGVSPGHPAAARLTELEAQTSGTGGRGGGRVP